MAYRWNCGTLIGFNVKHRKKSKISSKILSKCKSTWPVNVNYSILRGYLSNQPTNPPWGVVQLFEQMVWTLLRFWHNIWPWHDWINWNWVSGMTAFLWFLTDRTCGTVPYKFLSCDINMSSHEGQNKDKKALKKVDSRKFFLFH